MSTVDVAIPTWNGERYVEKTVASLLAQDLPSFGLTIFDDASTDQTLDKVRRAGGSRIEITSHRSRLGITANWNHALRHSSADYLVVAHQDDVYEPRFLRALREALDAHPEAFVAHARARAIDEDGNPAHSAAERHKQRFWPAPDQPVRTVHHEIETLRRGNYIMCPAVMMRRRVVEQLGGFEERYSFVADWDLWLRGLLAGHGIVAVNDTLVHYRRHDASETRRSERSLDRFREELELLNWLNERVPGASDPFVAVRRTLASTFARRLANGDRVAADALIAFAQHNVPELRISAEGVAMSLAQPLGATGGWILLVLERLATLR